MQASTPSRCLRSESDAVHSSTRAQASSRVGAAAIAEQGIRRGARTSNSMAFGTLARPFDPREPDGSANGEVHHRGRDTAVRDGRARRQQERGAARAGGQPSSPRRRSCCATSRASATSRRWSTCSRASASRPSGATTTSSRCRPTRSATPTSTRPPPSASAPRSCSPARCWRASARRTCRRPAAT